MGSESDNQIVLPEDVERNELGDYVGRKLGRVDLVVQGFVGEIHWHNPDSVDVGTASVSAKIAALLHSKMMLAGHEGSNWPSWRSRWALRRLAEPLRIRIVRRDHREIVPSPTLTPFLGTARESRNSGNVAALSDRVVSASS